MQADLEARPGGQGAKASANDDGGGSLGVLSIKDRLERVSFKQTKFAEVLAKLQDESREEIMLLTSRVVHYSLLLEEYRANGVLNNENYDKLTQELSSVLQEIKLIKENNIDEFSTKLQNVVKKFEEEKNSQGESIFSGKLRTADMELKREICNQMFKEYQTEYNEKRQLIEIAMQTARGNRIWQFEEQKQLFYFEKRKPYWFQKMDKFIEYYPTVFKEEINKLQAKNPSTIGLIGQELRNFIDKIDVTFVELRLFLDDLGKLSKLDFSQLAQEGQNATRTAIEEFIRKHAPEVYGSEEKDKDNPNPLVATGSTAFPNSDTNGRGVGSDTSSATPSIDGGSQTPSALSTPREAPSEASARSGEAAKEPASEPPTPKPKPKFDPWNPP